MLTFRQYWKTRQLARVISETWQETVPKKKNYCLILEECSYQASHYKMELFLLLCCFLSTIGSCLHKNTALCWVQSKERLQQFCEVSSGRKKASWWKSKLKCRRRNYEASSQQLLRLPDHAQEPTHCNEVPHWQKTHAAFNIKLFKKLDHVNKTLYEVELAKAQIEHKEPIIVGFFILQYAKLRTLELYYNFFTKFRDVNKFEELEMDTDSLYLALTEKELKDCIRPEMRAD